MWKLFTHNGSLVPAMEGPEPQQYESKDDALQQAWELMYGPQSAPLHQGSLYRGVRR